MASNQTVQPVASVPRREFLHRAGTTAAILLGLGIPEGQGGDSIGQKDVPPYPAQYQHQFNGKYPPTVAELARRAVQRRQELSVVVEDPKMLTSTKLQPGSYSHEDLVMMIQLLSERYQVSKEEIKALKQGLNKN